MAPTLPDCAGREDVMSLTLRNFSEVKRLSTSTGATQSYLRGPRSATFSIDREDIMKARTRLVSGLALAAVTVASSACGLKNRERGAIIGAGTGAVVGGVIGKHQGSTAKGAIIGAVIGGAAGAIIGHQMDQQAKELEQNIPGATVERVGEGIQVTFDSGLMFDFDSDRIRSEAGANLRTLAQSLGKYPDSNLLIVGHTDSVGTDSYNMSLSDRRAASAANFLVTEGVSRTRLMTRGLGETEPVATNDTDAGRQENRRVEVAIYASEKMKADARRQAGS
jgi:outer membrane protein OmpA-like peptidoglycan-associated protein